MVQLAKVCVVISAFFFCMLGAEEEGIQLELQAELPFTTTPFCSYYGLYYADTSQEDVGSNQIIIFTQAGTTCTSFALSEEGGVVVPWTGSYRLTYGIQQDATAAVALFANDTLLPLTANAATVVGAFLTNTSIVTLNANDILTLRSIQTTSTFSTIIPTGTSVPSVPLNIVIEYMGSYSIPT